MNQMKFKGDKSWFIIIALFVFNPALGLIGIIAKIIYSIYINQNPEDRPSVNSSFDRRPIYKDIKTYDTDSTEMRLSDIEEDLKETFSEWKESRESSAKFERIDSNEETFSMNSYTEEGLPVEIHSDAPSVIDLAIKDDSGFGEQINRNAIETEHLENDLNNSLNELSVSVPVEVDADIDLTFSDVHIDTEITIDEVPEDHDHEGETPLKIATCSMCGTENRIYKIDIFETPTCEKCGMLLLDRN